MGPIRLSPAFKRIKRPIQKDQALAKGFCPDHQKRLTRQRRADAPGLALARLETLLRLVDDVGAAATANHAVIPVTVLERLE
ncbi:MAG: hypothetical protein RLZZ561_440 [Pseudomonadota bacterium]